MIKLSLLEKAESYVSDLFLNANTSGLYYHNFNHTIAVVESVKKIATTINLPSDKAETLILSAWFHDVGYLYTRTEHETKSIEVVKNALRPNYTQLTTTVITCIEATKVGVIPQTELAAILKDADTAFGSAYDYIQTSNSYRKELKVSENKTFQDDIWRQMCIDFLENVIFYSDYGKQYFEPLVKQNLEKYKQLNSIL